MAFLDFLKKESQKNTTFARTGAEAIENGDDEEWGNLLPPLKPLSLTSFDSVEMSRKREDEVFEKKYRLHTTPLQGYEI